mgnify:CR=1 FL=1
MNFKEALKELVKYVGMYPAFYFCKLFLRDIKDLLDKELKGKEKDFFDQLVVQFDNIKSFKHDIATVGQNEILAHISTEIPLYSIHIKKGNKYNIRLLMCFEEETPIFLCAFYERSGKKRTSYKRFIDKALERYAMLKEER